MTLPIEYFYWFTPVEILGLATLSSLTSMFFKTPLDIRSNAGIKTIVIAMNNVNPPTQATSRKPEPQRRQMYLILAS